MFKSRKKKSIPFEREGDRVRERETRNESLEHDPANAEARVFDFRNRDTMYTRRHIDSPIARSLKPRAIL